MISEIDSIWDIMNGNYGNNLFDRFDEKNRYYYANIFINTLIFLMTGILFSNLSNKLLP